MESSIERAGPPPAARRSLLRDDSVSEDTYSGERPQDRTLMLMLSLAAMTAMTFLFASRFTHLKQRAVSKRNITSILVLALYVLVMAFFTGLVVLHAGQGLYSYELCFTVTWVCLVLYAMAKSVIYTFLVERIHIARAASTPSRRHDFIYIGSMLFMIAACGGIVINAFLHPYTAMSRDDGRCHKGISKRVTIPFLIVDVVLDGVLTGVFVYLLRPFVGGGRKRRSKKAKGGGGGGWRTTLSRLSSSSKSSVAMVSLDSQSSSGGGGEEAPRGTTGATAVQKSIKRLLWRSICGAFAITVVTVGLFMVQYTVGQGGKGVALVCSSICLADVFWGYLVIHYLTFCSLATEEDISRSTTLVEQTQHPSSHVRHESLEDV